MHSFLSPSSANRWLHCVLAPHREFERGVTLGYTPQADEGTLAHEYCAFQLTGKGILPQVSQEIQAYCQQYIVCCNNMMSIAKHYSVEQTIDISGYIPYGQGTVDFYAVTEGGKLVVYDLKYGIYHNVSGQNNEQLLCYTVGLLDMFPDVTVVEHRIFQPRVSRAWNGMEYTVQEIIDWRDKILIPNAKKAFMGVGETVHGDWCLYCSSKYTCKTYTNDYKIQEFSGIPISVKELDEFALKVWNNRNECYRILNFIEAELQSGTELEHFQLVNNQMQRRITINAGAKQ